MLAVGTGNEAMRVRTMVITLYYQCINNDNVNASVSCRLILLWFVIHRLGDAVVGHSMLIIVDHTLMFSWLYSLYDLYKTNSLLAMTVIKIWQYSLKIGPYLVPLHHCISTIHAINIIYWSAWRIHACNGWLWHFLFACHCHKLCFVISVPLTAIYDCM